MKESLMIFLTIKMVMNQLELRLKKNHLRR
ncbi:uncharacterized protein METZ01_LOCUS42405 [marine metagenome]|uniref:Uncharacterized protein n=1 Tax=marine metagenome TaxID=408172 RepID=A0A381RDA3_9ZZZZ